MLFTEHECDVHVYFVIFSVRIHRQTNDFICIILCVILIVSMGKLRRDLFLELHCYFETQTISFTIVGLLEKPSVPSSWCLSQGSLIPHRDNCDTRQVVTNSRGHQLNTPFPDRSFKVFHGPTVVGSHRSRIIMFISYRSILTILNLIFSKNKKLSKRFLKSICNNYKTYFSLLFYFHFRATHLSKL